MAESRWISGELDGWGVFRVFFLLNFLVDLNVLRYAVLKLVQYLWKSCC